MKTVPVLEHVSIWVKEGQTNNTVELFQTLGWKSWPNREGFWGTGSARFVYCPVGGVYLQLTEETGQEFESSGSARHIALAGDVQEMLESIRLWAEVHDFFVLSEMVGGGKFMVILPDLFEGAIELVHEVHPDLANLVSMQTKQ